MADDSQDKVVVRNLDETFYEFAMEACNHPDARIRALTRLIRDCMPAIVIAGNAEIDRRELTATELTTVHAAMAVNVYYNLICTLFGAEAGKRIFVRGADEFRDMLVESFNSSLELIKNGQR